MVIPGSFDAILQPGGDGYALITVDAAGRVTAFGDLGDGLPLQPVTAGISKNGDWPFYVPVYKGVSIVINPVTSLLVTNKSEQLQCIAVGWLRLQNLHADPLGLRRPAVPVMGACLGH